MHPSFVFLANVHGPTQLLAQSQAYTNTTIRLLELNPIAFSPRALPTINTEIRAGVVGRLGKVGVVEAIPLGE
jgi:acetaldehyde dehydrogenase (acetylating)